MPKTESVIAFLPRAELSSPQFILLLFLCMGLGVFHALGPGHGKSMMLASLMGESKSIKNALKISLVMGLTHVSDVLILGFASIFFVSFVPEKTIRFSLELLSGCGIILIGLYRLVKILLSKGSAKISRAHPHAHEHSKNESFRATLWSAFLYSLAPCPTAWIIFLTTLGLHKPLLGFFLVFALTLGVQLSITTIALIIVYSANIVERKVNPSIVKWAPFLSSVIMVLIGGMVLKEAFHSHKGGR